MIAVQDREDYRLNSLFEGMRDSESTFILKIFSLILFHSSTIDMVELYQLLGVENFIKVLSLYDGRMITFPKKEEAREGLLLSLLYYYREIEKKSWEDIKKEVPFEISSVSYGMKISSLNGYVKEKLNKIVENINKGETYGR